MKHITRLTIVALTWLCVFHVHAAGAKVGWVDGLQPSDASTDTVSISRDGKTLPYTPATRLLYEGDRIALAQAGLTLKLVIGENTILLKSDQAKPGSPYVVKLAGEIPSVQKNLLDWISDKLTGKGKQPSLAKAISASARNNPPGTLPLSMPIIGQSDAQLVSGKRDLRLSWQGGVTPYRIILKQGGKEVVADNITELAHTFTDVTIQEDKLELTLEDSKGKRFVETIRIVPEARRPPMPVPLKEARLEADIRNHLYGEWLLEQGNDWSLEALQWQGQ